MFYGYAFVVVCVGVLLLAMRAFHLASRSCPPELYCQKSFFNKAVISLCPILLEPYIPPFIWGKSGHIQTFIYGKLGRVKSPYPIGERFSHVMDDGATMTFDVFEPLFHHPLEEDVTMMVCPGLANSSRSVYIRTFVNYAQNAGYRVAVLNHLGAFKDMELTSPRIFNYGDTEEYHQMVLDVKKKYPDTKMVAVGFSMGGNIVVKYLGEKEGRQSDFICAITCCQGYDAEEAGASLMKWDQFRRVYLWAMALNIKSILRAHKKVLFSEEAHLKYGHFDEEKIFSATTLVDLDEFYSRRRFGFDSVEEYYRWASCKNFMGKVKIPMFILNALDDPIIPVELHSHPMKHAYENTNVIFGTTAHGGHLGYFEGEMMYPNAITWLDKVVVQYTDAIVEVSATINSQITGNRITKGFGDYSQSKPTLVETAMG